MATLNITNRVLAYDDDFVSNNPQKRLFDWSRQIQSLPVENPASEPFKIIPLQQLTLFNGTRTLTADNTTQYALSIVNTATNRYRLKWTGVGTTPAFRAARSISFNNGTVTFTPQLNSSVVVTASAGAIFGNVQVGDTVFIPGVSTGDSVLFDSLNEGFWFVLNATSTSLSLSRFPGSTYSSKYETVTITAASQFQVFSSVGVQLDDILSLVSGFATVLLNTYEIVSVTADSIEFLSGSTLPAVATVVPGSSAVVVYSNAKTYVYLETDQNILVGINGLSSFTVEPILAGDPNKVGKLELTSSVYSLTVTNKSTQTATIRILSAE
jgi:hypothetical protein